MGLDGECRSSRGKRRPVCRRVSRMQEPRSSLAASTAGRHVYVSGGTRGLFGAWDLITSSVELAALDVPARLTALGPAKLWIGLKNSDDVGLRVDLRVELFSKSDSGEIEITSATLSDVATGSAGFARALLYSVPLA